jgi:S-disulfanyl-L-cysteine oxidoreductase SoxD
MNQHLPILASLALSAGARRLCVPITAAALLIVGAAAAAGQAPATPDSIRSAADGAYTADQAKHGETVFRGTCGNCHGITEFNGPTFRKIWTGRVVFELFDQLRNTMPLDNPGGLSREQYAGVIAYVMKLNEYPAGDTELPVADAALKRIRF